MDGTLRKVTQVRDEEEMNLFKTIIAPPGTPDSQIKMALFYARSLGLDPLRKQVMIIETTSRGQKNYQIVLSIHAMGALAARQVDYAGINSAAVYEGEEITIDAEGRVSHTYEPIKRSGELLGAWSTAYRMLHGTRVAHTVYLKIKDYRKQTFTWDQQTAWMMEKTARAFSLRAAYPDVMANVYAPEEFGERSQESAHPDDLGPAPKLDRGEVVGTVADPESALAGTPTTGVAMTLAPTSEELPWNIPHCEICGSTIVRYTSKTGVVYDQCKEARENFLKTKDRAEYEGHHWKRVKT